MKPEYLIHDNLMDRREIFYLLEKLSPYNRLKFLDRCCHKARIPNSPIRPGISRAMQSRLPLAMKDDSASEKLSIEVFMDIWSLAIQYELNMDEALRDLEDLVRKST